MSYDVTVGDWSGNMTSNIGKMYHEHIIDEGNGTGLQSLDGLTGKQAAGRIRDAFERINRTRHSDWTNEDSTGEGKFRSRYDSKNGWGSTVSALIYLAEIMGACYANPRSRVRVSA